MPKYGAAEAEPETRDGLAAEHVMNVMHGLMEHQDRRERMLGNGRDP